MITCTGKPRNKHTSTLPRMHRTRAVTASLLALPALAITLFIFRDAIPGTFHRDNQGAPRGTGTELTRYQNGATMIVEKYSRGRLVRSEWFKPDGTPIQVTEWKDGAGEGLYLRQDGSIWSRMNYVLGVWDGACTYYNRDGSIRGEAFGHEGKYVKGYTPAFGERESD